MTSIEKNLRLARDARKMKDYESALKFYRLVYEEDMDDVEASYFSKSIAIRIGGSDKANLQCITLRSSLPDILEPLRGYPEEERIEILKSIENDFLDLPYVLADQASKRRDQELAQSHMAHGVSNITASAERSAAESIRGMNALDNALQHVHFAAALISNFGEGKPYIDTALRCMKSSIDIMNRYSNGRAYKDKGKTLWYDLLAERIKKYDPSYVMPEFKQNGAVAMGGSFSIGGFNVGKEHREGYAPEMGGYSLPSFEIKKTPVKPRKKPTAKATPKASGGYAPSKGASSVEDQLKLAEALKAFKDLLDNGVITQEEFDKKKEELLNAPVIVSAPVEADEEETAFEEEEATQEVFVPYEQPEPEQPVEEIKEPEPVQEEPEQPKEEPFVAVPVAEEKPVEQVQPQPEPAPVVEEKPQEPQRRVNPALKILSIVVNALGILVNIIFLILSINLVASEHPTGIAVIYVCANFLIFHIPLLILSIVGFKNRIARKITLIVFLALGGLMLLVSLIVGLVFTFNAAAIEAEYLIALL